MEAPDTEAKTPQDIPHSTVMGLHRNDGNLEIRITEDNLEARGDFTPPMGDGAVLSPDYIAVILERLGIQNGIHWDAIQEAALDCNLNHHIVKDVLIARGTPPEAEVAECYETDPSFRVWPHIPNGDLPRIDFRELSPFVIVKKNQVLARKKDRQPGKDGIDILGKPIPKTVRHPDTSTGGPNTRVSEEGIVAICEGRLVEKGSELIVEEVLAIKGEVGYKTGHILFPGDVILDGPVADGFKIYAGGVLVAKQTFDASEVITKKDLLAAGGIIGRGKASIRVGGSVRAKFIQNASIVSRGPILVGAAVINSQIFTLQTLDLGDKGKLIGGEVFAIHGVRAACIGNDTGRQPHIHCGVDFTVQQELDRTNERIRFISLKLSKLREHLAQGGEDADKLKGLGTTIEAEISRLGRRVGELLGKLDSDDAATIEVSGDIFKGTLIEICHIALVVEETLHKVRFRLDKTRGKLTHESL